MNKENLAADLAASLVKCTSRRYALIRLGTVLNSLRSERNLSDHELNVFLNQVRETIQRTTFDRPQLEMIYDCIGQFGALLNLRESCNESVPAS